MNVFALNPAYEPGPTLPELVAAGEIQPMTAQFFRRRDGSPLRLYRHQHEALQVARRWEPYLVTTGTGSGKTLTYLVPIYDHIVRTNPDLARVRAIIVYPMNALINSQYEALKAYAAGCPASPVRFGTGSSRPYQSRSERICSSRACGRNWTKYRAGSDGARWTSPKTMTDAPSSVSSAAERCRACGRSDRLAFCLAGRPHRGPTSGVVVQALLQGHPGQGGALDPYGELPHAVQRHQIAQVRVGLRPVHHALEHAHQGPHLVEGLALDGLGHHRGRRLADGAAAALEADLLDAALAQPHEQRQLVPAQRVGTFHRDVAGVQAAPVAGVRVVVEDDLAVKVV